MTPSKLDGEVGILNVGAGDTKLSFDPNNPADRIRAARVVKDMLRRGYALLVKREDGKYQRAVDFDEATCEYIIADFDPLAAQEHDRKETENSGEHSVGDGRGTTDQSAAAAGIGSADAEGGPKRGRKGQKRIGAESTRAVAVPRSAGG